jgi:hypothetical protein
MLLGDDDDDYTGAESSAVVVDCGTTEIRAGFAGDDGPAECFEPSGTVLEQVRAAWSALEVDPGDQPLCLSEPAGTSYAERKGLAQQVCRLHPSSNARHAATSCKSHSA